MSKIAVHDLIVSFGKLNALREVSLTVDEGDLVFISGPNGAGKSSLLRSIAGEIQPTRGRIEIDGTIVSGAGPEVIARMGVSMVPEGRRVFSSLTIEENLMLGTGMRRDKAAIAADLDEIYTIFPILHERRASSAGALSGGQQQMLVVGRAIMTNPKIVLVDEPSLGLAPKMVDEVYQQLCKLREERGLTLVIVEQSTTRAARVGGKMILLNNGEIVGRGRVEDFAESDLISGAYFGMENSQ
ncbi:ABC transporter ATP-binding protein [Pararhodobacter sp.]|uniref:ABC transporter ATP-binding protein n=1 Tax=Pararhodobacter sp. TaxID=2127056 RepID=UPI002AFF8EC1|nr:ABC transporter ATP-binding protein [Pararhodobacter sp.]